MIGLPCSSRVSTAARSNRKPSTCISETQYRRLSPIIRRTTGEVGCLAYCLCRCSPHIARDHLIEGSRTDYPVPLKENVGPSTPPSAVWLYTTSRITSMPAL